jgi:hypothetical protein
MAIASSTIAQGRNAMFIARYCCDVRFGHKDEYLAFARKWEKEIGSRLGWKSRVITGSIGAAESRVEHEMEVASLAELEKGFAELAKNEQHKKWGKEIEPLVVSGSNHWQIFRVVET